MQIICSGSHICSTRQKRLNDTIMEQTTNSAKAKQELFSVPKGYFNNLTPAVMQKIDAQNEPKALPKRKFLLLRPVYMVAASVLVAIGGLAVYRTCSTTAHLLPRHPCPPVPQLTLLEHIKMPLQIMPWWTTKISMYTIPKYKIENEKNLYLLFLFVLATINVVGSTSSQVQSWEISNRTRKFYHIRSIAF